MSSRPAIPVASRSTGADFPTRGLPVPFPDALAPVFSLNVESTVNSLTLVLRAGPDRFHRRSHWPGRHSLWLQMEDLRILVPILFDCAISADFARSEHL